MSRKKDSNDSKDSKHPEDYAFISLDGQEFFLGVVPKWMTRGQVRDLAHRWLREHRICLTAFLVEPS